MPRITQTSFVVIFTILLPGLALPGLTSAALGFPFQNSKGNTATDSRVASKLHRLQPCEVMARELKPGETHAFRIVLNEHDFLRIMVEQKGIDVVVRLFRADEKIVAEVDSPNGTQGLEPLSYLADSGGVFRLEIVPLEKAAPAGRYELTCEALRPASARDAVAVGVENMVREATRLRLAGKRSEALRMAEKALEQSGVLPDFTELSTAAGQEIVASIAGELGDIGKAITWYAKALATYEKLPQASRVDVARVLHTLAALYHDRRSYAKAEPLFQRALALREAALGPQHPDFIHTLNSLGELYRNQGDDRRAEPYFVRALALAQTSLPAEHPLMAITLNNLAGINRKRGEFRAAEEKYLRAIAIGEQVWGPDSPSLAVELENLGNLYVLQEAYAKAEPYLVRAMNIREKKLGPLDPDMANIFRSLGQLAAYKGDYSKAEIWFQKALNIHEKVNGPQHPLVAVDLNDLANLAFSRWDIAKALPLRERALEISQNTLGRNDDLTLLLNEVLADLYVTSGNPAKAKPLMEAGFELYEKRLGAENPELAHHLLFLEKFYRSQGDFAQAERCLLRALAMQEKALGPNDYHLALYLLELVRLYHNQGAATKADAALARAAAILEKPAGVENRWLAGSCTAVAGFLLDQNQLQQAEALLFKALAIDEKLLDGEQLETARVLDNLSLLYQAKGDVEQAVAFRLRSNQVVARDLLRNISIGSEREKLRYFAQTASHLDHTVSLHMQSAKENPLALKSAFTIVLERKGRVLDAMVQGMESLRRHASPEDRQLLEELVQTKSRIAKLTLRGPSQEPLQSFRSRLKALEEKAERQESLLGQRSAEFRVQTQPITLEAVQAVVPADAALVEFVAYRKQEVAQRRFGVRHYGVYVLTSQGEPQWADLGPAAPIDSTIEAFRTVLRDRTQSLDKKVKPLARKLDQLVLSPVRKLVGNKPHLLLSPDGLLNLVPFSALVNEQGKFLVETSTLTYLTSGRDLLRLNIKSPHEEPAVVFADPDFAEGNGPVLAGKQYNPLARLPWAATEGEDIQRIFPAARLNAGTSATERQVKAIRSPELLHIATHGYFLEDAPLPEPAFSPSRDLELGSRSDLNPELLRFQSPLLRSWLFFANANRGGDQNEDGIMTAFEAASLDLRGTKLVVLSACDTGLGVTRNGEGVYGLRRAFVLAGSEAQVMSLWPVSDQGTEELMNAYYQELKAGKGRSEALRQVQSTMLKTPGRQHPFFWASFIQSGEWGNLAGKR